MKSTCKGQVQAVQGPSADIEIVGHRDAVDARCLQPKQHAPNDIDLLVVVENGGMRDQAADIFAGGRVGDDPDGCHSVTLLNRRTIVLTVLNGGPGETQSNERRSACATIIRNCHEVTSAASRPSRSPAPDRRLEAARQYCAAKGAPIIAAATTAGRSVGRSNRPSSA